MSKAHVILIILVFGLYFSTNLQADISLKITDKGGLKAWAENQIKNKAIKVDPSLLNQITSVSNATDAVAATSSKSFIAISASHLATLAANQDLPLEEQLSQVVKNFKTLTESKDFVETGTGSITLADHQGHGGLVSNKTVSMTMSASLVWRFSDKDIQNSQFALENASLTLVNATKDGKAVTLDQSQSKTFLQTLAFFGRDTESQLIAGNPDLIPVVSEINQNASKLVGNFTSLIEELKQGPTSNLRQENQGVFLPLQKSSSSTPNFVGP
jgi:hypothetical protein